MNNLINKNVFLVSSIAIISVVYFIDAYVVAIGEFPEDWRYSIRPPVQAAVDWLATSPGFL